jgi:RimJ/RimL family protein N-acetyltransferase
LNEYKNFIDNTYKLVGCPEYMFIVRPLNWADFDAEGIPKDALDILTYFNKALSKGLFPYIPRNTPITKEQILKKWIPDKDLHITLVADVDGKVVAAATCFVNKKANSVEINITKDPECHERGIGTELMKQSIKSCLDRGFEVHVHTSVENKAIAKIMEKLGYAPQLLKDFKDYQGNIKASTYDAYEYVMRN